MVIVIIHWKIHPNPESIEQFFKHWKEKLTIKERSHLVGEFLSKPLSIEEAGFPCEIMNTDPTDKYASFFNIGMWEDHASFKREIIDPYVGSTPKTAEFEYEYRARMILAPHAWRRGESDLPTQDNLSQ